MSNAALESTVNTAFETIGTVSTSTKGEVRDAVDTALELMDKGEARVAERQADGKWKVQWDPLESTCRHASLSIL